MIMLMMTMMMMMIMMWWKKNEPESLGLSLSEPEAVLKTNALIAKGHTSWSC